MGNAFNATASGSANFLEPGNLPPVGTALGASNIKSGIAAAVAALNGGDQQAQPQRDTTYDAWGGQAAYNNLVNNYNQQRDNTINSANDSIGQFGTGYNQGINEYLFGRRQGQQGLDNKGVNLDLAKMQGTQGILSSVGRNIRSAGVMLANKNAGDSSAAGALAGAYGQQGQRQMADVGNQYAQGNQALAQEQQSFEEQQALSANRLKLTKDDFINRLGNDTRDKLAAIDAQIAGASLPNRIAYEQEKQNVRQRALDQLQAFDNNLNAGIGGIQAKGVDQRRESARGLLTQGRDLGADAFNYTTSAPGQFQGTGPFASELPLFALPRGKRQG